MTKTEEIRLHNLFIKFKNEGKGIDEIKGLLEVDGETVEEWNRVFKKTQTELLTKSELTKMQIAGIFEENNTLQYKIIVSQEISPLQDAKNLLRSILTASEGLQEEGINKNYLSQIEECLSTFEKYFISLNFNDSGSIEKTEYRLNSNDKGVKKLAEKAIERYAIFNYFNHVQTQMSLIKNISEDKYVNAQKILPYAIKTLKVKNYEGINSLSIEDLPIDTNWIFLIGENSYGKTTILKSIAIALCDTREMDEIIPESVLERNLIGIEYFSLSRSLINNVGGKEFSVFPHLTCYGPSRLQIQTDQTKNDVSKKSTTTYSLFNSDGILLNIEYSLLIWFLKEDSKFESVKEVFKKLIPYLEEIEVTDKEEIFYIEKEPNENGSKYNRVTFNQLASGFRSILAMVGDMMIRLFKSQPEITEPSELAGIVIIDELDLHWHPKMQREIPSLLSSIFPKVQFIASTHSLVPLLGAPENSVLLKVNRTVEEGITVEKVDIDFQALSSDTMLRDIFDLEEYMSDPKIKAWERYTKLKGLIHFEKDEAKKNEYIHEREILGDKYNFTL